LLGARKSKHYLQALSYFTYFSYSQLQLIIWIKTRLSKLNREKSRWQRKDINQAKKERNTMAVGLLAERKLPPHNESKNLNF